MARRQLNDPITPVEEELTGAEKHCINAAPRKI
jgi:hypothetical protein